MIKLKLPPTLRLLTLKEAPKGAGMYDRLKAAENNNIVEGYRLEKNPGNEYPYRFFAEINVDNDRLWALFKKLMFAMPEMISLITGQKDDGVEDVAYNDYEDKYTLYNKIEKFEKELTQDGFLQFGVIHQTKEYMEEVFVHSAKYIQYWGMDIPAFKEIMNDFSLYEIENLEYIDSYPMVTTALFTLDKDVLQTGEVLNVLRSER